MSVGMLGLTMHSRLALVDLSAKLFCFGAAGAGDTITLATAGGVTTGVIYEAAGIGKPVTVQMDGIAKVMLAATIAANVLVKSDGDGKAVDWASSGFAAGILLVGGDAGDIVPVKLF